MDSRNSDPQSPYYPPTNKHLSIYLSPQLQILDPLIYIPTQTPTSLPTSRSTVSCIIISAPSTPHSLISPLPPPLGLSGNGESPSPSSVRFRPPSITAANASAERTRSFNTCLSAPNMASFSLYEVLGIPMGASGLEIKAAYRRMARTCHPDVVTIGQKDSSADEFMKIHAAYSTLSDPEKRAQYDRRIFRLHRSHPPAVSAMTGLKPVFSRFNSGYTGRNWETDQCW